MEKKEKPIGPLENLLNALIAKQEKIPEEKVTVEYIQHQREGKQYPKTKYNIGSDLGGYETVGLTFHTGEELEKIEEQADQWLSKILKS